MKFFNLEKSHFSKINGPDRKINGPDIFSNF